MIPDIPTIPTIVFTCTFGTFFATAFELAPVFACGGCSDCSACCPDIRDNDRDSDSDTWRLAPAACFKGAEEPLIALLLCSSLAVFQVVA